MKNQYYSGELEDGHLKRLRTRTDFMGRLRVWNIEHHFVISGAFWFAVGVVIYFMLP